MTDLIKMIDSVPLSECRNELRQQFYDIANHTNRMKRAVLLCFIGEAVMEEISRENPDAFVDELNAYFEKIIAGSNSENYKSICAHVKENNEIVERIDIASNKLKDMYNNMKTLIDDYDAFLAEEIKIRDNLPVGKL
jgi:hypothetical protein